jgi:hypothetical protein
MTRMAVFGALLLAAPVVLALQDKEKEKDWDKPIPGWNPDLKDGFAEAKKGDKPLMIVFR